MEPRRLLELLAAVQRGECAIDDALERLRNLPYEDLGFAKLDHHRALRNGFPEVILGEGKAPEHLLAIAERMAARDGNVLVTRLAPELGRRLVEAVPGFVYEPTPRLARLMARRPPPPVWSAPGESIVCMRPYFRAIAAEAGPASGRISTEVKPASSHQPR